jgi:hypothetical protein
MPLVSHSLPWSKSKPSVAKDPTCDFQQNTTESLESALWNVPLSRLAALGSQIHDRMAGMFLPFARS